MIHHLLIAILGLQGVTVDTGIVTVPKAIEAVAKATGKKLYVAPDLRNEVVRFRVHDFSEERLMSEISEALAAEWKPELGGLKLYCSTKREAKWKADEAEKVAALIRMSLEQYRSPNFNKKWEEGDRDLVLGSLPKRDQTEDEYRAIRSRHHATPAGRLFSRLIDTIDLKRFWNVPLGEVRTFSNDFGSGIEPLGQAASRWIAQFDKEQWDLAQRLKSLPEIERESLLQSIWTVDRRGFASPPPYKVQFRVIHYAPSWLHIRLEIYDGDGAKVAISAQDYGLNNDEIVRVAEADWKRQPLGRVPESVSLTNLLYGKPDAAVDGKPLDDLDRVDPLSLVFEPWLDKHIFPNRDLIGRFSDEALEYALYNFRPDSTLGELAESCMRCHVVTQQANVAHLTPIFQWTARQIRADRNLMAGLVHDFRSLLRPNLDRLAQYVTKQNDGAALSGFEHAAMALSGFDIGMYDATGSMGNVAAGGRDSFKLYGSLSPGQRSLFLSQGSIPYVQLQPLQRGILDKVFFRRTSEKSQPTNLLRAQGILPLSPFLIANPLRAFPFGIPPEAKLKLSVKDELTMFESSNGKLKKAWEPSSLGYIYYQQKDNGEWLNGEGGYVDVAKALFLPGRTSQLAFEFQLSPQVVTQFYLKDEWVDPNGKLAKWDAFEGEYKSAFEKTLAHYRANPLPRPRDKKDPP